MKLDSAIAVWYEDFHRARLPNWDHDEFVASRYSSTTCLFSSRSHLELSDCCKLYSPRSTAFSTSIHGWKRKEITSSRTISIFAHFSPCETNLMSIPIRIHRRTLWTPLSAFLAHYSSSRRLTNRSRVLHSDNWAHRRPSVPNLAAFRDDHILSLSVIDRCITSNSVLLRRLSSLTGAHLSSIGCCIVIDERSDGLRPPSLPTLVRSSNPTWGSCY
jgi:hypothetical protein